MAGRLLLACYVKTKSQVDRKMAKAVYLQMSFDGWLRTQGTQHLLGYTAGIFGMTCFLDFTATKENHCTAKYMMEMTTLRSFSSGWTALKRRQPQKLRQHKPTN